MTLSKHKSDHVILLLNTAGWLLISLWVKIKVCTVAWKALWELTSALSLTSSDSACSPHLFSFSHTDRFAVPPTCAMYCEFRAFALTVSFEMLSFQPLAWLTLFPSSLCENLTFLMCLMLVTRFNIAMLSPPPTLWHLCCPLSCPFSLFRST